jgi:renalase
MEKDMTDVLVVGAGLSGLMAARALQERGLRVTLVDKGQSVGGRLATRRVGPGRADHGAQFFTARTPEFQSRVDAWAAAGLVYRWSTGWARGSLDAAPPDGHARYAARGGMNALAKHLAGGLDVRVRTRLPRIRATDGGWAAEDEGGGPTPPAPCC